MRLSTFLPLLFATFVVSSPADAENWPGFRGPDGAGVAEDAKVPLTWGPETENLKWKVLLPGPGSSSPIVWGDHVFVTCYSGYGDGSEGGDLLTLNRHLLCVDAKSGSVV